MYNQSIQIPKEGDRMIQDIFPSALHNSFIRTAYRSGDRLLCFRSDGGMLACANGNTVRFPTAEDAACEELVYAFSVDDTRYFIARGAYTCSDETFSHFTMRELRERFAGKELFAAFTGYHLWRWYADNRFCGRCGEKTAPDDTERALRCPACGNVIYPRINPAVIVGVTNGDSLLITRYRRGFAHNALVAGFAEIGETLEQTVSREVMEETGIHVKNIRYYKSQPWGMAQDLLAGFFCDADGSTEIRMDANELKYAEWVKREDIVLQPNNLSLTNEMMRVFRDRIPIPVNGETP